MTKKDAYKLLKNNEVLSSYDIYAVEVLDDRTILFNACDDVECFYGLWSDDDISLEYAGLIDNLQ